jgi:lipopolysaccharide/colanic/teichoic acid biosynthesis glycosyltransferase
MREGLDGRRIPVWKLRTMRVDGDRLLEQWFETHRKTNVTGATFSSCRMTRACCL